MRTTDPEFDTIFSGISAEDREALRRQEEEFDRQDAELHEANLAHEDARTRANRKNALFSTGPRTLSGQQISKMNAVRHGLTGRQVLLPKEDANAYAAHVERFRRDHQPKTERELELTQMLADTQWRINRIPRLESAIYAMGRIRYVDLFRGCEDPELRSELIDVYTMEQSGKELRNLSLQEGRLRRQYANDLAELKQLQSERQEKERLQPQPVAATAKANSPSPDWVRFYDPAQIGEKHSRPDCTSIPNNHEVG